jgi:uncharacterized protein
VIGHVGWVVDGQPFVTPTNIWRAGDRLYWHGSAASTMLRQTAEGARVCITATIMDGLVLARSGTDHSVNYRSVMVLGTAYLVDDPAEKLAALEALVEHLYPGRWAELRPATAKEVKATTILWTDLDEASAKLRSGGPHDEPGDETWPAWAGVIPVTTVMGAPVGDEFVPPGMAVPGYLPDEGDGFNVR